MGCSINLNGIYIFYWVAKLKSITAASRQLNSSKPTFSRKLAELEEALEVTLIVRNTRCFQLTPAGEEYFQLASQIINLIDTANTQVQQYKTDSHGTIKLCIPPELNSTATSRVIKQFMDKHPDVSVEVTVSDKNQFSVDDGYDLLFRLGDMDDCRLVSRNIGTIEYGYIASADYIEKRYISGPSPAFVKPSLIAIGGEFDRKIGRMQDKCGAISVSDVMLAKNSILAGLGVARLPLHLCSEELGQGSLQLLQVEASDRTSVNLVFMQDRYMPEYIRKFVDYLVALSEANRLWSSSELYPVFLPRGVPAVASAG
ncbi:LysR family transcriptional regulator [Marinagarivorans cellulosilyticus]|uniref:LysR family transcriptional regulator, regulator for bpeEF and oprC n=1 Tax=Marinagarivorans cellulosilyticus TaxID=2721545 RepID=A0AAN1WGP2_9GAMM|nr:LysR family transcriptional regulator [Marinagarivorans cellulosilyticus]BCD97268.1 LysR family transcriptional regulator, regulator for bpeEF and oprC [Marinagarivorans cellulosilyticus]